MQLWNEYVDLEKNELNTEHNSKSRKNKIKEMQKHSNMIDKKEKKEILILTKKILENIHLLSEEYKNSIKNKIIIILLELFDIKILNEKITIINDILNGENIEKAKEECISLLKLIYRRKNEIKENIISSFIKELDKTLKEADNEEIIKKNEVDLFIKKLKMIFDIEFEEEFSNVKFERLNSKNEKPDKDFENNRTNADNLLNENELKYAYGE